MTSNEMVAALRQAAAEIEKREELMACAYQLCGLVGAPEKWLDAMSRNEGSIDLLLPVAFENLDEFVTLKDRIANLESQLVEARNAALEEAARAAEAWDSEPLSGRSIAAEIRDLKELKP